MNPEDEKQVRLIVAAELERYNQARHDDLFNTLLPIRSFLKRVEDDLYGREGEAGIVKLIIRHDTLLWILVAMAGFAILGILILLVR